MCHHNLQAAAQDTTPSEEADPAQAQATQAVGSMAARQQSEAQAGSAEEPQAVQVQAAGTSVAPFQQFALSGTAGQRVGARRLRSSASKQ